MAKRAKVTRALIAGLIAAVVVAAAIFWPGAQHQPTYSGRPLQYWVDVLADDNAVTATPFATDGNAVIAAKAINAAGTNALPFLLRWIRYEMRPSTMRQSLARLLRPIAANTPIYNALAYSIPSRWRLAIGTVGAFRHLGDTATPAIPELLRLASDKNSPQTAFRAFEALGGIGTNSVPTLLQIANNPQHFLRVQALCRLTTLGIYVTQAIPDLERLAKDPEPHIAFPASNALYLITRGTRANFPAVPQ